MLLIMSFSDLRIDVRCQSLLRKAGIEVPTPIQREAIPVLLTGADLIGIAQTGTGKTLAFGLPTLTRLAGLPRGTTGMLVLTPTRELCQQVHNVLAPHAKALGLTIACVYGGVGMEPQAAALRRGTSIIVACPGRLLDHMQRGNANFSKVSALVLDEADRMLDMGFLPDLRRIVSKLPTDRQTMMFSATFPTEIAQLAANMQRNPQRVEIGAIARPADTVRQEIVFVSHADKTELLKRILTEDGVGPTIVFLRTKHTTDKLAKVLARDGFSVEAIHGGQSQNRRSRAIEGFRTGRHRILIATDVAARGIDVKGVTHVINYDIPSTPDDYVHRIGRTARAEAEGDAITFVTSEDRAELLAIERAIGFEIDSTRFTGSGRPEDAISKPGAKRMQRGRGGNPGGGRRRGGPGSPSKPGGKVQVLRVYG